MVDRNSNIGKAERSMCLFAIVTIVPYESLGILCDKDCFGFFCFVLVWFFFLALKRGKESRKHCWLAFHIRDKHHTHALILQEKRVSQKTT